MHAIGWVYFIYLLLLIFAPAVLVISTIIYLAAGAIRRQYTEITLPQ